MAEYIDKVEIGAKIQASYIRREVAYGDTHEFTRGMRKALKFIQDMPAADVQPIRRGRWEEVPDWYDNDVHYRCSACNAEFYLEVGTPEYNEYWYCPHCGADCREKEEK